MQNVCNVFKTKMAQTRINKGFAGSVARVQIPLSLLETRINKGFFEFCLNTVCKIVFKLFLFLKYSGKGKSEWCQIFPTALQIV